MFSCLNCLFVCYTCIHPGQIAESCAVAAKDNENVISLIQHMWFVNELILLLAFQYFG